MRIEGWAAEDEAGGRNKGRGMKNAKSPVQKGKWGEAGRSEIVKAEMGREAGREAPVPIGQAS